MNRPHRQISHGFISDPLSELLVALPQQAIQHDRWAQYYTVIIVSLHQNVTKRSTPQKRHAIPLHNLVQSKCHLGSLGLSLWLLLLCCFDWFVLTDDGIDHIL